MFAYFRSAQGRLLALAMALPLIAGVIAPFEGAGMGFYALPIIIGLCLSFVALGLSLEEYPGAALTAVIALPVAIFLYIPLLGIIAPQMHGVVYLMGAMALALLAIAARPKLPARAKSETHIPRVA